MLTLTRLQVPLPRLIPLFQSVPLPNIVPPLHDVREAVERDVRGLWAGMDALRLHDMPAANDDPVTAEPAREAPARSFRPPLGWVSLAAAGALFAALGFAQIQLQRHLSPTVQQPQKARTVRKHNKLRRVRPPERTDYSRGT